MTQKTYLYGKNPFFEALSAQLTKGTKILDEILLTKESESDPKVISKIQASKLTYKVVTKSEIESLVGKEATHQGICASLFEKSLYTDMGEIFERHSDTEKSLLFILLDELQDPHNVGAIIRSAKAFGADAVLLPEFNQTLITGTVIKTSSGMNFHIPIVKIGNINTTIKNLKEKKFWVYGLSGDGDTKLPQATFDTSTLLIIGSEGTGIKQKTLEACDFKLAIPIEDDCESLNASVATSVALYEWRRQNPKI